MSSYFFGNAATARPPSASGPRRFLVIGAYPSAVHAAWQPPSGKPVRALPVADEPIPFWDGEDADEHLSAVIGRFPSAWGTLMAPADRKLNGSSGVWVRNHVLRPLAIGADEVCITDCLDTYRLSNGAAARLADTYAPVQEALGLPPVVLPPHPGEDEIVCEALELHRPRLLQVLAEARPELIVTLGNAALRVLAQLVKQTGASPSRLVPDDQYGTAISVLVGGRRAALLPLAHPASPGPYQRAHARWMEKQLSPSDKVLLAKDR